MNQLTNSFKLLSDETRLRIVVLLAQQELCVCEICGVLELSQPKVSKHLAKLRDRGFVTDQRKEQFIFYSLKIEDDIVSGMITNMVKQINNYHQFSVDSKRLVDKNIYSSQCNTGLRL